MIQFLRNHLSFEKVIELIANIPYKVYHVIMFLLISVCINCNYFSIHKLPMIGVLIAGFVVIIYFDIYSIKQTYEFFNNIGTAMAGDNILLLARTRLEKRMYSNLNWLIILIAPAFILPVCYLHNQVPIRTADKNICLYRIIYHHCAMPNRVYAICQPYKVRT